MLHHIGILLVLVIRPVRLDNPIDSVNRTGDTIASNEFRQIPVAIDIWSVTFFLLFPFFFFFFFSLHTGPDNPR